MAFTRTIWQDSPSTSTPITAAQLQRMEDGIRAGLPFFDVRDYGAALDDTTNDAARLQAALDAAAGAGGGTVLVPGRCYLGSTTVTQPGNTLIRGVGPPPTSEERSHVDTTYPGAVLKPLGRQTEPLIGTPRILVVHTMVGGLRGSDSMFRGQGYSGTESHFGLGGPTDGSALDGVLWQWQTIDRQADAQNAGNAYATSVETSDGGDPSRPWSDRQLTALVGLAVWWCRQVGAPARLVDSTSDRGIGYHAQFREWAPDGRSCPGPVRIEQLRTIVIPRVAAALSGTTSTPAGVKPKPAVPTVGRLLRYEPGRPLLTGADVKAVQAAIGMPAGQRDGKYGPLTRDAVRHAQIEHHLTPDGAVGPDTTRAIGLRWTGPVAA